jgi:hypothetical protein
VNDLELKEINPTEIASVLPLASTVQRLMIQCQRHNCLSDLQIQQIFTTFDQLKFLVLHTQDAPIILEFLENVDVLPCLEALVFSADLQTLADKWHEHGATVTSLRPLLRIHVLIQSGGREVSGFISQLRNDKTRHFTFGLEYFPWWENWFSDGWLQKLRSEALWA